MNKLEFGIVGICGKIGLGVENLNIVYVRRIMYGYVKYLLNKYVK